MKPDSEAAVATEQPLRPDVRRLGSFFAPIEENSTSVVPYTRKGQCYYAQFGRF
ncbi:MAG: hypothetical protein JWQ49_586 [Edaphobacter sp.]|nr:hypothetical protein [Edaphobacter sp.]